MHTPTRNVCSLKGSQLLRVLLRVLIVAKSESPRVHLVSLFGIWLREYAGESVSRGCVGYLFRTISCVHGNISAPVWSDYIFISENNISTDPVATAMWCEQAQHPMSAERVVTPAASPLPGFVCWACAGCRIAVPHHKMLEEIMYVSSAGPARIPLAFQESQHCQAVWHSVAMVRTRSPGEM